MDARVTDKFIGEKIWRRKGREEDEHTVEWLIIFAPSQIMSPAP